MNNFIIFAGPAGTIFEIAPGVAIKIGEMIVFGPPPWNGPGDDPRRIKIYTEEDCADH